MNKKLIPAYLLTFVNVLGFSILMPVLPFIVKDYGAPKWVYGMLLTLYAAFQFIGSPLLGSISDAKGRKPILLVSQLGTLMSWVVFAIALSLPEISIFTISLPIWIIGLSRILDGVTGGNVSVTNAYVADVTTRKEKTYVFGYLGGILGIGMIVGPGIGGFTSSSSFGYHGTLYTSIAISLITLISIYYWVKESHPKENRIQQSRQDIIDKLFIIRNIRNASLTPIIKLIFKLKLLISIVMAFYMSTIALYLIDLFKFDQKQLGTFMLFVGIFLAFNQVVVSKFFIKRLGAYKTLMIGFVCVFLGLFSITLTDNIYLFLAFYYVMNLGISLVLPTFNTLIAIHTSIKQKGQVMGISESINSLTLALFPILGASLYGWIGFHIYHFMSVLPFTALLIALFSQKIVKNATLIDEN